MEFVQLLRRIVWTDLFGSIDSSCLLLIRRNETIGDARNLALRELGKGLMWTWYRGGIQTRPKQTSEAIHIIHSSNSWSDDKFKVSLPEVRCSGHPLTNEVQVQYQDASGFQPTSLISGPILNPTMTSHAFNVPFPFAV